MKLTVTPQHRVVWKGYTSSKFKTRSANFVAGLTVARIPLGGTLTQGTYKPSNPRLLVAALGDGSFQKRSCIRRTTFSFSREKHK